MALAARTRQRYPRTTMRGIANESSLAVLVLCLGCESVATNTVSMPPDTNSDSSSLATASTGAGDSGGTGGSASGAGGTSPDGTSAAGAGPADTSDGDNGSGAANSGTPSTTAPSTTTTTAGGTTGGQVSASDKRTLACLEYVLAFCEYSVRCSTSIENVIQCFERNSTSCPDVLFAPGSSRTVDGTFACADDWRALSCDLYQPECATAGTRTDGEACVTSIQCASRYCSGSSVSCGVCRATAKLGDPCDYAAEVFCEPGLSCHLADFVCVTPADATTGGPELGEACDPGGLGCYPNACIPDDAGVYTCKPYPKLGEDCSTTLHCAEGDSYCDTTLVCLELPKVGYFCGTDAATGTAERCAQGLACDTLFYPPICLSPPAAPGVGEPCEGTCQAGLTCRCSDDACDTEICLWARLEGESCSGANEACVMGECVDGTCVVSEAPSTFAELCGE